MTQAINIYISVTENIESGANTKLDLHEPGHVERLKKFNSKKPDEEEKESKESSFTAMLGLKSVEKKEVEKEHVTDESGLENVTATSGEAETTEPVTIEIDREESPEVSKHTENTVETIEMDTVESSEVNKQTENTNETSSSNETECVYEDKKEAGTIEIEDSLEIPNISKIESLAISNTEPVTIDIDKEEIAEVNILTENTIQTSGVNETEGVFENKMEAEAIEIEDSLEIPTVNKTESFAISSTEPVAVEIDKEEVFEVNKLTGNAMETSRVNDTEHVYEDKTETGIIEIDDSLEITSVSKPKSVGKLEITSVSKPKSVGKWNTERVTIEIDDNVESPAVIKTEPIRVTKPKPIKVGDKVVKSLDSIQGKFMETKPSKICDKIDAPVKRQTFNVASYEDDVILIGDSESDKIRKQLPRKFELKPNYKALFRTEHTAVDKNFHKGKHNAADKIHNKTEARLVHHKPFKTEDRPVKIKNDIENFVKKAPDKTVEFKGDRVKEDQVCLIDLCDETFSNETSAQKENILAGTVVKKQTQDTSTSKRVHLEHINSSGETVYSTDLVVTVKSGNTSTAAADSVIEPYNCSSKTIEDLACEDENSRTSAESEESDILIPLVTRKDPKTADTSEVSDKSEIEDEEIDSDLLEEMLAAPDKELVVFDTTSSDVIPDNTNDDRNKQYLGLDVISNKQENIDKSVPETIKNGATTLSRPTVDNELEMETSFERTLVSDSNDLDEELVFEKEDDLQEVTEAEDELHKVTEAEVEGSTYGSSMSDIFREDTPIDETFNAPIVSENNLKDNVESAVCELSEVIVKEGRKAKHKSQDIDLENHTTDSKTCVSTTNESRNDNDHVKHNLPDIVEQAYPDKPNNTSECEQDNSLVDEVSDNDLEICSPDVNVPSSHMSSVCEKLKHPEVKNKLMKLEKASNLKRVKVYPVVKQKPQTRPMWLEEDEHAGLIENYVEPDQDDVIVLSDSD